MLTYINLRETIVTNIILRKTFITYFTLRKTIVTYFTLFYSKLSFVDKTKKFNKFKVFLFLYFIFGIRKIFIIYLNISLETGQF